MSIPTVHLSGNELPIGDDGDTTLPKAWSNGCNGLHHSILWEAAPSNVISENTIL